MFVPDNFYRHLGAEQSLGPDEQLLLYGEVRVSCTPEAVTAIFETMDAADDKMESLFQIADSRSGFLPFLTRSGHLAFRIASEVAADETSSALECLDMAVQRLGAGVEQGS